MFANYWDIQNRIKYIKEELSRIEGLEKGMPAGEIIVAKNNKNYIEKQLTESIRQMEEYIREYPDFPVTAHYANPVVRKRMN